MYTLFQTRIDANQKKAAEQLFNSMGMTLGSAFKMFIAQSLNERRLPFQPSAGEVPNTELKRRMHNVEDRRDLVEVGTIDDFKKMCEKL